MKEKKDPAILEAFLSLVLLFFLCYNPCFPLAYKMESRVPHEGDRARFAQAHDTSTRLSGDQALSTRSLLSPETWDHFPLSLVCNPYYKLSVLATRAAATNCT